MDLIKVVVNLKSVHLAVDKVNDIRGLNGFSATVSQMCCTFCTVFSFAISSSDTQ